MSFQRPTPLGVSSHTYVRNTKVTGVFVRSDCGERDVITGLDRWGHLCRMKSVIRDYKRETLTMPKPVIVKKPEPEKVIRRERKEQTFIRPDGVKVRVIGRLKYGL